MFYISTSRGKLPWSINCDLKNEIFRNQHLEFFIYKSFNLRYNKVSDELNIVAHFRFNNTKGNAANIHNFPRTLVLSPSGGSCHQPAIKPGLTEGYKRDISTNKNKQ